jgi:CheY-like chemotaxis protein
MAELARPRILMVDDRPDALLALEVVLEPLGAELVAARSGIEALQQLLAGDFAVIILDVQMPEIDGFETARLIRQRERCRYVPIVFLTAISGEPHHFMAGYEAGAFDYLYKPYDPELLRAKISVLLRLWAKDALIERQHDELVNQFEQLRVAHATVQRQSVELERSNAALERMGEAAAAGLRRPLSLALGFLQLALGGQGAPVDRDLAHRSAQCLARAKDQLDSLRAEALAHPAAGEGSPVDLDALSGEVTAELARKFPECRFEASGLPTVTGDPALLRLLVHEVLEATAARLGQGTICLAAEPETDCWRLVVTDDGPLASPAALVRSLTSFGDGAGALPDGSLGLARRAAERHGGLIGADAGPGQGTVLWVRLPAVVAGGSSRHAMTAAAGTGVP